MKPTIKDYRKDKRRRMISCPYCHKGNNFDIYETDSGLMSFRCTNCDGHTIMPFKKTR